ncbi:hypothetical protein [Variovorax paradoxus]|jgi:hypothetical protein|uniref:hypothetical protein n=1 Tax=Variovorax paradoxus TaxID=34073 RepID=UPI001ABBE4C2
MATATTKAPASPAKTVKGLRIVARAENFRRAGRAFGREAVEIPLSELSDKQIKALRDERELLVVDCEIEAPAQADETAE